jgi:hypothetical protein
MRPGAPELTALILNKHLLQIKGGEGGQLPKLTVESASGLWPATILLGAYRDGVAKLRRFHLEHKRGNTLLQGGLAPERKQFQRHGRIRDPHNLEGVLLHLSS